MGFPSIGRAAREGARRAAAALAALVVLAATSPLRAAEETTAEMAREAAARAAIVAAFGARPSAAGRGGPAAEEFARSPAGRFLRAVALPEARFEAAAEELLADEAIGDDLARAVRHQLETIPARHADRLRGESRYNLAAEGTNAVLSGSVGLVQGNTTVIGRVALVIARVLGGGPLDPRERKERVLLAGWLARRPAATGPGGPAEARARLAALDARWRADEAAILGGRADEATRFRRFAEARFFARALGRLDAAAGAEAARRVAAAEAAWRRARGRGLRVALAPAADRLDARWARRLALAAPEELDRRAADRRAGDDPTRAYLSLVAAHLRADDPAARAAAARLAGLDAADSPLVRRARALVAADPHLFPESRAARELDYHRARVWHFVVAGRRDFGENAYITAYGAIAGVPGLLNTAVFFGLDTVLRLISVQVASPLPADEAIDALWWTAQAFPPGSPEGDAARRGAIDLLVWCGEPERALRLLGAWGLEREPAWAAAAEDARADAAERAWVRLRAVREALPRDVAAWTPAEVVRFRAAYARLAARFPGTGAAARAVAARDALPPPPVAEGILPLPAALFQPAGRWGDLTPRLGLAPRLLDGDPANGELARVELDTAHLRLAVVTLDEARRPLAASPDLVLEMIARRDDERRIAARELGLAPYRRQALPLAVEGGFGGDGVDLAPQLKKLPFRDPDAHLYRR